MLTRKILKVIAFTPFLLIFSPAIAQGQAADEDETAGALEEVAAEFRAESAVEFLGVPVGGVRARLESVRDGRVVLLA